MESEINDAEIIGLLSSPLNTQEREASADEPRIRNAESADEPWICHSDRQNSGQKSENLRNNKKFENFWIYKQIEQFKENRKLFLSILKQNSIR